MTLKEFLKILDSILPIAIYYDGDICGIYAKKAIPTRWLDFEIEDVYVDSLGESIGVGLR